MNKKIKKLTEQLQLVTGDNNKLEAENTHTVIGCLQMNNINDKICTQRAEI